MNTKPSILRAALRHAIGLLLAVVLHALPSHAQTPQYMTYQGYLADGNGNTLGSTNTGPKAYDVVFRIWDAAIGGNEQFGELQTVTVDNGYFSVLLGQGTAYQSESHGALATIFTTNTTPRYVEMTVLGIGAGNGNVTILPRLQLVSAPYAFSAANANALVSATTGKTLISSSGDNLSISGSITSVGSLTNSGGSIYLDNAQLIIAKNAAGVYENCFYPRWSDNVTYLNYGSGGFNIRSNSSGSAMWMSPEGTVGIGNTAASAKLDVSGSGWFRGDAGALPSSAGQGVRIFSDTSKTNGHVFAYNYGSNPGPLNLILNAPGGNVGLGTFTPGFPLTFPNTLGDKISLYGQSGNHFGFGIQGGLLQIYTDINANDIAFGFGQSSNFTETMRIKGNGNVGIGTNNPTSKLEVNGNAEIDANLLVNGNVGIGTNTPAAALDVAGSGWFRSDSGGLSTNAGSGVRVFFDANNVGQIFAYSYGSTVGSKHLVLQAPGGFVGIGTGVPQALLHINKATNPDLRFQDTAGSFEMYHETSSAGLICHAVGNSGFFKIQDNGQTFTGSDRRLKKNIFTLENVLDRVVQLRPVRYQMKNEPDGAAMNLGFIAQEVEPLFPEVVSEANGYKAVAYANMVSVAVGAIKELNQVVQKQQAVLTEKSAKLDALEQKAARVDKLESEVADLKKMVAQLAEASKSVKMAEKTESSAPASVGKRTSLITASRDQ